MMTRKQLYDLVWSKPMRDAAAEIGISDVGLKKVCLRHRVPVPPQGYWNKVHAGKPVRKVIFHPTTDPDVEHIEIQGGPELRLPPEVIQAKKEAKARERAPEQKIVVSPSVQATYPAVITLAAALRKAKLDERGLVSSSGPGIIRVSVAQANVDRAVLIFDRLLSAMEARGHSLSTGADPARLVVNGEILGFSLTEKVDRVPHHPTPEEVAQRKRAQTSRSWELLARVSWGQQWDYRPTGKFTLALDEGYHGLRRRWADGNTQRVEDQLNDFLAGAVAYAAAEKAQREEMQRRQRQYEEEQRRRAEAERRRALEKRRIEFLDERLQEFELAERLERFMAQVRVTSGSQRDAFDLSAFLEWGERRIAHLREHSYGSELGRAIKDGGFFQDP